MRTEIFYFQLLDDSLSPPDLKDILRTAFSLAQKALSTYILVETPQDNEIEKIVVLQGMLKGNLYRTFAHISSPCGSSHIYIFSSKNLPLPLTHFKHAKRRADVFRPMLREGGEVLTNCNDPALQKDVPRMKIIQISEVN